VAGTVIVLPTLERDDGKVGPVGWLSTAAFLGTPLAADIGFQGSGDYGTALGVDFLRASYEVSHLAFHPSVTGGFALILALLLLYIFWKPLKSGDGWAFMATAAVGLLDLLLLVAPIGRELSPHSYGHAHPSVWLIPLLWFVSLAAAACGLRLNARRSGPVVIR